MKLHKFSRMAVSLSTAIAFSAVAVAAADGAVYPVRDRAEVTSLNGMWAFEMDGKKGTIQVPGNWETQGWKTPQYGCVVDDKTGIYRRKFQWNPLWKGRRVILRFDGVLFSYEAKVNGKVVGGSGRAFNMSQFDITDVLIEGENEVEVAVRSRTKDDSWLFDTNDCWGICGIFRDVEIFSVPSKAWIADIAFTTKAVMEFMFGRVVTDLSGEGWTLDGKPVEVPHTWNAIDGADGKGESGRHYAKSVAANSYAHRRGVYRRSLPDAKPGRRYFLRFQGASQRATVRVNGEALGSHVGAFTAFAFEATRQMKPEVNLLEVEVDVLSHFGISGGKYGLKLSSTAGLFSQKSRKG